MGIPVQVLIVEDSEDDALLLLRELRRGGYDPTFERVETEEAMAVALDRQHWEVVIADYIMPRFSGPTALHLYKERNLDIPFIVVSGKVSEERAVEALKAGAHDFVNKNNLSRLVPAIQRELRDAGIRKEHRKALEELRRLAILVESSDEAIMGTDLEGVILHWNPGAEKLFGYHADEILGRPLSLLMPPNKKDDLTRILTTIKRGESLRHFETTRIRKDGMLVDVSVSVSPIKDNSGRIIGVSAIDYDITERKVADEKLKESHRRLERTIEETMHAMALTVEIRDPYTSGHQRRVAKLAIAIAREMALPGDQIYAIQMAADIHDIGKIYVPAEFLSKPGHLSELEFDLMKAHARIGYDILKSIEFPWPIAHMVLQHHERLDGSGYPAGLKGEEILLEARILAVADVVEAMSSHRPYRPTLGINRALQEVSGNKGTLYDTQAVMACLRAFTEIGLWD